MIQRIWRGWTRPAQADAYQRLLLMEIFPGIAARDIQGYRGIQLLRREAAGEVEFMTIMWFDSLADVRAFSGEDYETAVVTSDARALLTHFDEHSAHYETVLSPFSQ